MGKDSKMKIEIIDNFISSVYEDHLENLITSAILPVYYNKHTLPPYSSVHGKESPQFTHGFFADNEVRSSYMPHIEPIIFHLIAKTEILRSKNLIRCKLNLNYQDLSYAENEHYPVHTDNTEKGITAIYYINDSDGNTFFFDKDYKGDFDKVVKNFVSTKIASKEFLQVDPELEKRLGAWFGFWKKGNPESLINFDPEHLKKLISKNKSLIAKSGDIAYDEVSKKIYYIYFDWNDKKETKLYHCGSLSDEKSEEPENIPLSKVSKFKVIKRLPFTDKNTGYTMVPKRTID